MISTIGKHVILVILWAAYTAVRFPGLSVQFTLRFVMAFWFGFAIILMLVFLSIIFYQMAQLMKNSKSEYVKQAQKKVLI